jgi:hypothetical protein
MSREKPILFSPPMVRALLDGRSLNAKRGYSWQSNPWVWVYTFERVKGDTQGKRNLRK